MGAPYYDAGSTDQGAVFAYLTDSSGLPSSATWTANGASGFAYFGYSLAATDPIDLPTDQISVNANTFQGDILADLVVGSPGLSNRVGGVYVYFSDVSNTFGSTNRTADKIFYGTTAGSDFGNSVAVGDVDGDGIQDLMVGEPNNSAGYVHLYLGRGDSAGLNSSATATLTGSSAGEQFGFSVSFAGNVNQSTTTTPPNDILVGAPNWGASFSKKGKIYLFDGDGTGGVNTTAYWTDTGTTSGERLGYAVCGNSDIDGQSVDGRDFFVGAPFFTNTHTEEGRILVYRANSSGDPMAASILETPGHMAGARLGYSLATGDLDQDGNAEIIAGAPRADTNTGDHKGRVFVFFGVSGTDPNPTPDTLYSPDDNITGEQFGSSVASIIKTAGTATKPCVAAGAPFANSQKGLIGLYEIQP